MEDVLPQGGPAAGARPAHETTQIDIRGILISAAALIGTVGLVQLVLGLAMQGFTHKEERPDSLSAGRLAIEVDQFPTPRLQKDPTSDLARLKEEERSRLNGYGWVDRRAGIAHIPVERAMDILAKTGLPNVPAPAAVEGAPPGTSIPPATKREEPASATDQAPQAKKQRPRPESKQDEKP